MPPPTIGSGAEKFNKEEGISLAVSPPKISKDQFLQKWFLEDTQFILLFAKLLDDETKE